MVNPSTDIAIITVRNCVVLDKNESKSLIVRIEKPFSGCIDVFGHGVCKNQKFLPISSKPPIVFDEIIIHYQIHFLF